MAVSYQFELPRVRSADLDAAIRERAENWMGRTSMSDEEREAFTEHVEGIAHAAETLVSWMGGPYGARGDERLLRVVVAGHANPYHAPREGYSDEHVTISLGVLPATEVGAVDADPVVVEAPDAPVCEECPFGTTLHHSDPSGGWDQCVECGHMQNIRPTPGGEPGRLTELSSK